MYFCPVTISSLLVLLVYGFVFTWLTIPRIAEVVRKYKIFRKPNEKRSCIGGLFLSSLGFRFMLHSWWWLCLCPFCRCAAVILVLGAGAIVVYVGIRDDIYQLGPLLSFCFSW